MTDSETSLKPCPFCGSSDLDLRVISTPDAALPRYTQEGYAVEIGCNFCGIVVYILWSPKSFAEDASRKLAIKVYNSRAIIFDSADERSDICFRIKNLDFELQDFSIDQLDVLISLLEAQKVFLSHYEYLSDRVSAVSKIFEKA